MSQQITQTNKKKRFNSVILDKLQKLLVKEFLLRKFKNIRTNLLDVKIERSLDLINVHIVSNKPGVIIGHKGVNVNNIRQELVKYFNHPNVAIRLEENSSGATPMMYADEISRMIKESDMNIRRICSFIQRDVKKTNNNTEPLNKNILF